MEGSFGKVVIGFIGSLSSVLMFYTEFSVRREEYIKNALKK